MKLFNYNQRISKMVSK